MFVKWHLSMARTRSMPLQSQMGSESQPECVADHIRGSCLLQALSFHRRTFVTSALAQSKHRTQDTMIVGQHAFRFAWTSPIIRRSFMNSDMSIREFIRAVERKASSSWGFQALQHLTSPGIDVEANVWSTRTAGRRVEFHRYESALLASEETLAGTSEFVNEELAGMIQATDGRTTWCYDPARELAVRKLGQAIQEPLPGLATLGEFAFLETLARDYLIRDLGTDTAQERATRKLGLRPKSPYRSQFLRALSFPFTQATLTIDSASFLPVRVAFTPSADSPTGSLLGTTQEIVMEYSQGRALEQGAAPKDFEPPADTLVFTEDRITSAEAQAAFAKSFRTAQIESSGFSPSNPEGLRCVTSDGTRQFISLHFSREAGDQANLPQQLLLLFGNYLSPRMSRLRTSTREQGTSIELAHGDAWCFDRTELWEQLLPGLDQNQAPVQVHWELEESFWFACFTGVSGEEAIRLVDTLHAQSEDTEAQDTA